ncbi:MAG: sterol desaturase/sphingolipid hydroxylase (fatty acid hydroxylase superfamily) [Cocleimonas sp.]|jgi:sterol desaturase/sphingolipid hydroxylase (fatty acid hydroxylase superfamily)
MFDSIINAEGSWRLGTFILLLVILSLWELISPRREKQKTGPNKYLNNRRLNNVAIVIIDTVLVRFLVPLLPVGAALYATQNSLGLFNVIELPMWIVILFSLLILDLIIYFQHRIFHVIPLFWRLHRMHHTDIEFDFTTAIRFHPIEIMLSILLKLIVVLLLGAPAIAVLIFEILLSSTALFNHSNINIPKPIDKLLRRFIVTPDMHRVHHSVHRDETDSNFGFNIPWWDRLFGTYCAQPRDGHLEMSIGIEEFRSEKDTRIDQLLIQPFKSK